MIEFGDASQPTAWMQLDEINELVSVRGREPGRGVPTWGRAPGGMGTTADGRRRHYGGFYGTVPTPPGLLALAHGNCQAEPLRVMLSGSPSFGFTPVRIPPVHELTADDLPHT